MSDSQKEPDGFRSREQQIRRRQEIRKRILEQYRGDEKRDEKPMQKFVGLSHTLNVQKKESDQQDQIDMFGEVVEVPVNRDKTSQGEVTDESGYYNVRNGQELDNGKYRIVEKIGKGMFGVVVKAQQIRKEGEGKFFAIKIMRKNELMLMSGEREYKILSSIKKPEHIVPALDYFHSDGHLFLVCQLMGPDLRGFITKNQNKINLQNIKQYGIWMFLSLHELRKNQIIHADIKPDNFLFMTDMSRIKLGDFGTAYRVQEHSVDVDYLVARYYRSPQIIFGCETPIEQRYAIDTWSVGCSLFELFTGKFLFEGESNNQMVKLMMQTKGKFSNKMLKKAKNHDKYFDSDGNFLHRVYDKNTKEFIIKKTQVTITPHRQLLNLLKKYSQFQEDMKGCLMLNPKNRLTPEQAFKHPFLNYQVKLY